jgi:hypothetical protein
VLCAVPWLGRGGPANGRVRSGYRQWLQPQLDVVAWRVLELVGFGWGDRAVHDLPADLDVRVALTNLRTLCQPVVLRAFPGLPAEEQRVSLSLIRPVSLLLC